jgi:uncharacterized membrane protein YeaQ/YmgE (transglycosylase-associated protein family)
MSLETLIIWLVIGAIAGWLAGVIVKGYGFGLVGNIVVGILGAIFGGWLFGALAWAFARDRRYDPRRHLGRCFAASHHQICAPRRLTRARLFDADQEGC